MQSQKKQWNRKAVFGKQFKSNAISSSSSSSHKHILVLHLWTNSFIAPYARHPSQQVSLAAHLMFLNNLYLLSYQRGGVRLSNTRGARSPLSAEGPSQPATLHSLFYFISLGFWLMSVTATGNKMLVRVCAVASERRLWYIVRPFASVSWLPCHRLHVYWLGVNKAKGGLRLFRPRLLCKRWGFLWCGSDTLSGNINACVVMSALLLATFSFFCIMCAVHWFSLWLLLSLLGMNWGCKKKTNGANYFHYLQAVWVTLFCCL